MTLQIMLPNSQILKVEHSNHNVYIIIGTPYLYWNSAHAPHVTNLNKPAYYQYSTLYTLSIPPSTDSITYIIPTQISYTNTALKINIEMRDFEFLLITFFSVRKVTKLGTL